MLAQLFSSDGLGGGQAILVFLLFMIALGITIGVSTLTWRKIQVNSIESSNKVKNLVVSARDAKKASKAKDADEATKQKFAEEKANRNSQTKEMGIAWSRSIGNYLLEWAGFIVPVWMVFTALTALLIRF